MANIPSKVATKLQEKFTVSQNTFSRDVKTNPQDRIQIEIGDSKQSDFKPQFKLMRWDNEVNFSMRAAEHPNAQVKTHGEKIKYITPNYEVHQYEKPEAGEDGGFEFEWVLPSKPSTNVLTATIQHKNLQFFYQPSLTPEEVAEGVNRPENVVGSYAVYHKTKGGLNRLGEMEYKTGKAFHIYRPQAKDSSKNVTWCDLDINEAQGILTVTVPQDWLDSANYPVTVDPTFGNTNIGASSGSSANKIGSRYTITENGNVSSITQYVNQDGSNTVACAIFTNNGSTLPDVKVAEDSGNTTGAGAAAWLTNNITASLTASTQYWLVGWASDSRTVFWDAGATNQYISDGAVFETWADPWGGTGTRFARALSIYATYTTSSTGQTPTWPIFTGSNFRGPRF